MSIHVVDMEEITEYVIMGIIALAVLSVILVIICTVMKNKDNSKPIVTKKAKILEKTLSQGNTEWYNVELEDGQRLKLRSFKAKDLIITAGDIGILSYQGQTIVDFKR